MDIRINYAKFYQWADVSNCSGWNKNLQGIKHYICKEGGLKGFCLECIAKK